MATLTSFDQVVNIIKNHSTVPCFILGSNTVKYNPNNLANPDTPQLTHFTYDNFYLAPELANLPAEDINAIQEYLDPDTHHYTDLYIIPLYKLKEVLENFNKKWIRDTQQGISGADDYFNYIPDMLDQYRQIVWAYCEYEDNNTFKAYWNLLHNTILKNFLKANDQNGLKEHVGESLTALFQCYTESVNEDKVYYSSQYID